MPSRIEEITQLTEDMVKFKSTKSRPEEVEKCIDYIKDYFSGDEFVVKEYEKEDKKSLVVMFEDTKEPEYLLHGHIDVVEAEEKMFEPEIEDGRIYGRGTGDMKAGVACLMRTMKELSGEDERPSVALMVVSDEEVGGFNGAGYLFDEVGYEPGFAISAEPNNMEGYLDIVAKQKGILQVKVSAEGDGAHGSRPWKGENAAEKLLEKYHEEISPLFPDNEEKTWKTTCNLGVFEAGEAVNSVPNCAEMMLDIRWSNNYTSEEVLEDLKNIDGIEVEVVFNESMLDNDAENRHIQDLKRTAEEVTDENTEVTRKEPGSDMRFLTEKNIPAVVFGPEGYNSHSSDEYADIESFEDYCETLKRLIVG